MAKFQDGNNAQELLDRACQFVERMLEKKTAADAEAHEEMARHQARNTWAGILLVVVTLGVGAGGIIYKAIAENRDRNAETLRQANKRKLEIISNISGAMSSMRELKDINLTYCDHKISAEQKQNFKVDRVKRRFELVRAGRPRLHFFSENFRTLLIEFLKWEELITDYCDPAAPSEEIWRKKQKEIETEMVRSPAQIFVDGTY